jgi:hypothetical protein
MTGEASAPSAPVVAVPAIETELLAVLDRVTRMCDHVIEYIAADRAERQLLVETLDEMMQTIAALSVPAMAPAHAPAVSPQRERVIGGSMPSGPEPGPSGYDAAPIIDLREVPVSNGRERESFVDRVTSISESGTEREPSGPTPVEVRCRFSEGERWVRGFELVEVYITDDGWRYRLRRLRDGATLSHLFDAASIRPVPTCEQPANHDDGRWSRY